MRLQNSASVSVPLGMTLSIVSCAHGRAWLTDLWATHLASINVEGVDITVTVAVTAGDKENVRAVRRFGFSVIEVANEPLGAKHNAALGCAPAADAYMILPSDDFVHPEWVKDSTAALNSRIHYVVPTRCGLYHPETGRTCILTQLKDGNRAFGAARVWSHAVVEKAGTLWTPNLQRGLDSDTHRRIRAMGFEAKFLPTPYVPVVDVKSGENLWAYDSALNRRCAGCEAEEVLGHLSKATRAALAR